MQLLNSENVSSNAIHGFKADIHKRWKEKTEEQKRRELVSLITVWRMSGFPKKRPYAHLQAVIWGRTSSDFKVGGLVTKIAFK